MKIVIVVYIDTHFANGRLVCQITQEIFLKLLYSWNNNSLSNLTLTS